jgi:FdhD protein
LHGSRFGRRDALELPPASVEMSRLDQLRKRSVRALAEECPVALVYQGTTVAVVMATPADLIDLAVGFSLTEGIINSPKEIEDLEIVLHDAGIELRMWLAAESEQKLRTRRRQLVGPTGCGLCGIESLSEAARPLPRLRRTLSLTPHEIAHAMKALTDAQILNVATRAMHAAGFYLPQGRMVALREDVGRHNALDKLAGALAADNMAGGTGAIVLTSRVSVEMVQKAAMIGANVLIAVSAPTALAVRTAVACGMTLVGVARGTAFETFSHPEAIGPD